MKGRLNLGAARVASALCALLVLGGLSKALLPKSELNTRLANPAHDMSPVLTFAVLGGLQEVLANFVWLDAYASWERRELEAVHDKMRLAVKIDPEEWFFWSNGARILAYDFPRWQIDRAGELSDGEVVALRQSYGHMALQWLEGASVLFAQDYRLQLEKGMIQLHVLGDLEQAAESFKAASLSPGGPLFCARIYAELMRKLNQPRIAYDWYCALLLSMPPDLKAQQIPIVIPRIRALEAELEVSESKAFRLPQGIQP